MGAMRLTMELIAGTPINSENVMWLKMLIGFDVIYTAVSLVLVETILVG
jgi:heme exporter protein B